MDDDFWTHVDESIGAAIYAYRHMVGMLPFYDEFDETLNLLITREGIAEDMAAGKRPSERECGTLRRADNRLAAQWRFLLERFPAVFDDNADIPREYWWWHLDEGPQVRELAAAAAGR